jgi:hypothetical protein
MKYVVSAICAGFITLISGCATTPPPLVKLSKTQDAGCQIILSIANRYEKDIQGNYLDIAFLDRSNTIIDRVNGLFSDQLFQSGRTRKMPLKTKAKCDAIEGVKVYSMSFSTTSGASFSGNAKYSLEVTGFTLNQPNR